MNTRYQIVETSTGEGGFGRIDKALDTVLERYVALKILEPLFKESPSSADKERFKREAKTLASLSHPYIPAIYEVQFPENDHDEEFKLIFEWIEGKTVRQFLDEKGVMSLEQVKKWFAHICWALDHAHHIGIIHRDIKPSNLIITTNMQACYLVDFGISLRQSDWQRLTPSSYPMGTPGYMSPEQQRGETLDTSSDIYSLAIVLYECLSGKLPSMGEYNALNTLNEAIPPAIDELILACLREEQMRRVTNAANFFQELTNALQPHASFSEILSRGSLYEIQAALSQIDSQRYAALPLGQRLLMMGRIKDLIEIDQFTLRSAVASLLSELVRVGYRTREKDYAYVIEQSLDYGYEKQSNGTWIGHSQIRETLNQVAIECHELAHRIITEKLLFFLGNLETIEAKDKGYYHDLKILLQNLLANVHCADEYAEQLSEYFDKVSQLNR